jgi:FKBP-type peptidyl-prolyl cis-trans isomerase FkpA
MSRIFLAALCACLVAGCGKPESPSGTSADCAPPNDLAELGLGVETTKNGYGRAVCVGDTLTVHTTGWLYDADADKGRGERFWSSYDGPGQPLTFVLGAGRMIEGWDLGLPGALIGETRELTIPAEFGYGESGRGPIPPNATLLFEIEVLKAEGPGDDG